MKVTVAPTVSAIPTNLPRALFGVSGKEALLTAQHTGSQEMKMSKTVMSGVCPNSHSVGVLHPSRSCAVWFMTKHTHSNAKSQTNAGALLMSRVSLVLCFFSVFLFLKE